MSNITTEQIPYENINPSEQLTTLLLSFNLCKTAIGNHNVMKDHITEALFHQSIITYYSIFKDKKEKKLLSNILTKPPKGLCIKLRRNIQISNQSPNALGNTFETLRELFEKFRDKNLAHKDSNKREETGIARLEIPQGAGGGDTMLNLTPFTYSKNAFTQLNHTEKQHFLTLIEATIDIWWQKEQQPIYKYKKGKWHKIIPPKLNFDYS